MCHKSTEIELRQYTILNNLNKNNKIGLASYFFISICLKSLILCAYLQRLIYDISLSLLLHKYELGKFI